MHTMLPSRIVYVNSTQHQQNKGGNDMSIEENKAIVRRLMNECWNKKNMSILDELVEPNCPHHMNGPVNLQGPEDLKNAFGRWLKALPDIELSSEDVVAEGDKVVFRGKIRGTHKGELNFMMMPSPIPATGKQVEIELTYIMHIANGKAAEMWATADYSWIQQLNQS
jgi:predicted ester cyclase